MDFFTHRTHFADFITIFFEPIFSSSVFVQLSRGRSAFVKPAPDSFPIYVKSSQFFLSFNCPYSISDILIDISGDPEASSGKLGNKASPENATRR